MTQFFTNSLLSFTLLSSPCTPRVLEEEANDDPLFWPISYNPKLASLWLLWAQKYQPCFAGLLLICAKLCLHPAFFQCHGCVPLTYSSHIICRLLPFHPSNTYPETQFLCHQHFLSCCLSLQGAILAPCSSFKMLTILVIFQTCPWPQFTALQVHPMVQSKFLTS